jgi:hypothetical protein
VVRSAQGDARADGSVGHVEVVRMGGVGTSILGDLDLYPALDALNHDRLASTSHFVHLTCEEPDR